MLQPVRFQCDSSTCSVTLFTDSQAQHNHVAHFQVPVTMYVLPDGDGVWFWIPRCAIPHYPAPHHTTTLDVREYMFIYRSGWHCFTTKVGTREVDLPFGLLQDVQLAMDLNTNQSMIDSPEVETAGVLDRSFGTTCHLLLSFTESPHPLTWHLLPFGSAYLRRAG